MKNKLPINTRMTVLEARMEAIEIESNQRNLMVISVVETLVAKNLITFKDIDDAAKTFQVKQKAGNNPTGKHNSETKVLRVESDTDTREQVPVGDS